MYLSTNIVHVTVFVYLYYTTSAVQPVDRRDRSSNRLAVEHDIRASSRHHHLTVTWCVIKEQITWLLLRRRPRLDYCNGRQTRQQSHQSTTVPAAWSTSGHFSPSSTGDLLRAKKTSLSVGRRKSLKDTKLTLSNNVFCSKFTHSPLTGAEK